MLDENQYILQMNSLVEGSNKLDIQVSKELFDKFGCDEAEDVDVKVILDIEKSDNLLALSFNYKGFIYVLCGRCLKQIRLEVDKQTQQIIKIVDKLKQEDWMEGLISQYTKQIDLSAYIYEELRVMIPIAPVHAKESDCDKQMIDKLSEVNNESLKNKENEIDPRWEKLKELKNN